MLLFERTSFTRRLPAGPPPPPRKRSPFGPTSFERLSNVLKALEAHVQQASPGTPRNAEQFIDFEYKAGADVSASLSPSSPPTRTSKSWPCRRQASAFSSRQAQCRHRPVAWFKFLDGWLSAVALAAAPPNRPGPLLKYLRVFSHLEWPSCSFLMAIFQRLAHGLDL